MTVLEHELAARATRLATAKDHVDRAIRELRRLSAWKRSELGLVAQHLDAARTQLNVLYEQARDERSRWHPEQG